MEVGLGGRFDATNVILPEVCLLTSISYDHTEALGNTLTQIATEKCGILKPGCVVISHPQMDEAGHVIQTVCRNLGLNLIKVGQEVIRKSLYHNLQHQFLEVKGRLDNYQITIPLLGSYQLDNTAAAIAALEVLIEKGYSITREAILKGLAEVDFPGRMQIISRNPLIVMDGGHNPGAAYSLKQALEQYFKPVRAILVIGVSSDKDISGLIKELVHLFNQIIVTRANNPRSIQPEVLAVKFAGYGIPVMTAEDISKALTEAIAIAGKEDLICVTGSLFVVGEAIEYIKGYNADH
jgi:dihydrofolate synthase/folylpolyglutamate synthase